MAFNSLSIQSTLKSLNKKLPGSKLYTRACISDCAFEICVIAFLFVLHSRNNDTRVRGRHRCARNNIKYFN